MLTYIAVAVVAVILILLGVVALQPADFRVERTATIPAPAADIFPEVCDLRKWLAWSPWEQVDPTMQRTYAGPKSGVGATYSWAGNRNIGAGRMTITECRPHELIRIKLEFFKPFRATNTAEFTFEPHGDGETVVTWSMYGAKNFFAKALHLVFNMDKMVGGQFALGLANLKSVVESETARQPVN